MIVVFRHLICYKVNVGILSAAKASITKAPQQQQQKSRRGKMERDKSTLRGDVAMR